LTVHVETFTNTSSFIAKGDTFSVEKFKNQQKRSTKILKHHILPYPEKEKLQNSSLRIQQININK